MTIARQLWRAGWVSAAFIGGGVTQFLLCFVLIEATGCPTPRMLLDEEQHRAGARAFGLLRAETGATGMRLAGDDFLVRLPGETLTLAQMRVRFPDAVEELDAAKRSTWICSAYFFVDDWDAVCVQWSRGGRVGGLKGIGRGEPYLRALYHFDTEYLANTYDGLTVQYWSADGSLLRDWERLGPFQEAPKGDAVAPASAADIRAALSDRTRRGDYGYYNTDGFPFSTPYSRVSAWWKRRPQLMRESTLEDVPASIREPVIEVLVSPDVVGPFAGPRTKLDAPVNVQIIDADQATVRAIAPRRIIREHESIYQGSRGDPFVAEFSLQEFRHGRTIETTFASGTVRRRIIKLNGIR